MEIVLNTISTDNTILMFTTRSLCYNSAAFFISRLSDAFEQLGFDTQICELDMAGGLGKINHMQADELKLESFIGKNYRAVIDFNSRLPRMVLDDGSYYLDHINAPFYNYVLDNPLYHHSTLSCTLNNYNVVLVDRNHCNYVKEYYPHIKNVIFSVLSSDKAMAYTEYDNKKHDIIFPGTYRNPAGYLNMIMSADYLCENEKLRYDVDARCAISDIMKAMLEMMRENTAITMCNALETVLNCTSCLDFHSGIYSGNVIHNISVETKNADNEHGCRYYSLGKSVYTFTELMNYVYPVEMYLRNFYREKLADAFIKNGTHLTVLGDWWDRYDKSGSPYITWERPVTFSMSSSKIAQYAVVLDSSPFFKSGIHDRVFAGMANKTAVVTDYSVYKSDSPLSQCVSLYQSDGYNNCVEISKELLINKEKRYKLVDNAYKLFNKDYTWSCTAKRIAQVF